MRRLLYIGIAIAIASVCGCGSDSATGTTKLSASAVAGRWEFSTPGNSNCVGAAGPATYYVTFPPQAQGAGDVYNIVSTWDVVATPRYGWLASGNVNLSTGTLLLNFWQTPLQVGSELDGTISADGTFVGTLQDPKPGGYQPHYVLGSCTFSITGRRTGP